MRVFLWVSGGLARIKSACRYHRRLLILLSLSLVVGLALGIWLGSLTSREYAPIWVVIISGEWKPFATFGKALLLGLLGIAVFYLSLRFRTRFPYFLYLLLLGYVWGRLSAMSVVADTAHGAVSVVVIVPVFFFAILPSVALLLTTLDRVTYTLDPRCNVPVLKLMLYALLWTVGLLFVYVVVILGVVNACINLV